MKIRRWSAVTTGADALWPVWDRDHRRSEFFFFEFIFMFYVMKISLRIVRAHA
jgi:hypothetical protein